MSEQNCANVSTSLRTAGFFKSVKFIIISYMISLLLILVLTVLVVYTDVPESVGNIGVVASTYFGSFLSACLMGRSRKRGGLIYGAIMGAVTIAGLFLLGMALYGELPSVRTLWIKTLVGALLGAFGGIVGVNTGRE